MVNISRNYCAEKQSNCVAKFLTIYLEEAHATDEWWLPTAPGAFIGGKADIKQHKTMEERIFAANKFANDNNLIDIETICDSMLNEVNRFYQSLPERLYIVENGVVVYQGGLGPFDYKLGEIQDFLSNRFGLRGEYIDRR